MEADRRMRLRLGWVLAAASVAVAVGLPACSRSSAGEAEAPPPAEVQPIEGSDLARVILTQDAAKRLDIQTDTVRTTGRGGDEAIPYSAVLYDPEGRTWTYTNPEPLTYVRAPIEVDRIKGQVAVLSSGPPAGTTIVTVGASELLGTEYEVGEE